jgi:hypothetical protein
MSITLDNARNNNRFIYLLIEWQMNKKLILKMKIILDVLHMFLI